MLIVANILYLFYLSRKESFDHLYGFVLKPSVKTLFMLSLVLLASQVILGTQVREAIDAISASLNFQNRSTWISGTGLTFLIHRSFSIIVLLSQGLIIYFLFKQPQKPAGLLTMAILLLGFTLLEAMLGAVMAYFGIPAIIQPIHLLIAVMVFGIQFLFVLVIQNKKIINKTTFV
jgi:cytochrome c oxidase assembly protein subunit 15